MPAIHVTKTNYETEVLHSDRPVLIDFWATWCAPCQMLLPIIEELSEELESVKVCKINVDEEREIASKYNVMSIPTLILLKDGQVSETSVGFVSKEKILEMIQ